MTFDLVIFGLAALAAVFGYRSGLLRSLATILGYVVAAPFALGIAPAVAFYLATRFNMPPAYNSVVLIGLLILIGMVFAALLRRAMSDVRGTKMGPVDGILGAALGIIRIGLVAVLMVVIFDRLLPPAGRQPPFLQQSALRPYLSAAGQAGVRKMPSELIDYIDRLKQTRRL